MRFELFDTNGKGRNIVADVSADEMRVLLSKFKTHCAIDSRNGERSEYEYNHFVNWVKKYHSIVIKYVSENAIRVDM